MVASGRAARSDSSGEDGWKITGPGQVVGITPGTALVPLAVTPTIAEPPPPITPLSAWPPMITMRFTLSASGSRLPSLRSSTLPSSTVRWATAKPASASTFWCCGGLSKLPCRNIVRRMRATMSFRRACGTTPPCTARRSGSSKNTAASNPSPAACWSRPASAAFEPLCTPPQSDITKPGNFHSCFSTWFIR
ncbi:hypothetical protein G6F61_013975 [Rhizopus arrhizus]|nr:hypothetical protein G6F61_013975 [Rhizopus arrhizus]